MDQRIILRDNPSVAIEPDLNAVVDGLNEILLAAEIEEKTRNGILNTLRQREDPKGLHLPFLNLASVLNVASGVRILAIPSISSLTVLPAAGLLGERLLSVPAGID
jgi:hypothetical protein